MKIVGIITEYNPFHNGHLYHLKKAKEITNADVLICITTTYFSMRGDVSVLTKKEKAELALKYGCDLVVELPYILGTQNADIFAYSAVSILNKLKVNEIVSGSELDNLDLIKEISNLEETQEFNNLIKENLNQGYSLRKSFSLALEANNINEFLSNDLLNLKYYDAIKKLNKKIKLTLIKRLNNNYNDLTYNESNIQSATAIRCQKDLEKSVPIEVKDILETRGFLELNSFTEVLKHLILTLDLKTIFEANEGLDKAISKDFENIDELISTLATKRYTKSRIKRFITYILTNTKTRLDFKDDTPIRVLGFNQNGQNYLNKIKKEVNLITTLKEGINPIYDLEFKLAKIFKNIFKIDFLKIEQSLPVRDNN